MSSKNSQSELISVVMPVYNSGEYLKIALESVLAQTYTNFEIIAINDGSTDKSLDVLEYFAKQDQRIKVINQANQGIVKTLNTGVQVASGEFIARMDADDVCLPERFEKQIQYLRQHLEVAVVGTEYILINDLGMRISKVGLPAQHEAIDASNLVGHCSLSHPSVMFRKALFDRVGGYREKFKAAQDLDLWLRMAEVGELANLGEALMLYRIHDDSISGKDPVLQRKMGRMGCEDAWQRRKLDNIQYEAGDVWRATGERKSKIEFYLNYGWRSYNEKYMGTAKHYAYMCIKINPFMLPPWVLLVKSLMSARIDN